MSEYLPVFFSKRFESLILQNTSHFLINQFQLFFFIHFFLNFLPLFHWCLFCWNTFDFFHFQFFLLGLFTLEELKFLYQFFYVFFFYKIWLTLIYFHFKQQIINQIIPTINRILNFFWVLYHFGQIFNQSLSLIFFVFYIKTFLCIFKSHLNDIFFFFFSKISHVKNENLV